ncbi:Spy/CpxP family protein refolding chaperone [Oceanospirillum linum]|nr:Spy/CpxP family protein refolding chaperone [Oceanospirillum linum]SEF47775.1 LTXXQ motif family protein [Oleiphilus messinensis]SMP02513.1 protein refolding chaperone Spy/CpxP family [Oceanospirillum linum]
MTLLKNMKSKKTFALLGSTLAALTLSAAVAAHPGKKQDDHQRVKCDKEQCQEQHAEHRLKKLKRFLKLSDAQTDKIKSLFAQHKEERGENRSPRNLQRALIKLDPTDKNYENKVADLIENAQKKMAERIQNRATLRQEIYLLLSQEQRSKLELMEEMRQFMGDKGPKGPKGEHRHHKKMRPAPMEAS